MIIGIDCSRAFSEHKTGTENYSYHLVKHLLRVPDSQQHKFVLFTRPNAIMPDWLIQKNVEIHPIHFRYLWTQVGLAAQTWKKFTLPECRGLDLLWVPAHTLPVLRRPGLKTVVTIHGLEYQWLKEYKNWLQKWYLPLSTMYAAKNATKLIAVSKFTKKQLENELHTNSKKIKVVYEGVATHTPGVKGSHTPGVLKSGSVWGKYGLLYKKYVLFVGTVQPRKNLVALVEAFSQTKIPKLVIAGSIGWMAEEILGAPLKWGVQDRVMFTGRVSDLELELLYQGAGLYVQPSITEGFGLPILEAMMTGVPVISSDGGALPEVVGKAGLIVGLGNEFEQRLTKAMKLMTSDKKFQNKLISMGYERAKEFNWDRAAKETLEILVG